MRAIKADVPQSCAQYSKIINSLYLADKIGIPNGKKNIFTLADT